MSTSLKERIYEIYRTFSAGHLDQVADMFDDRVDFISNAPVEIFPYLGHRVGKAQVMKALEAVHDEFSAVEYLPLKIIIDGQSAGVIVSIRLTQRTTGRLIRVFSAHFLQFKDNRIVEYRALLDTFEAVQQVLGRELDLR
jgi:ketosteroid isomerase-like protein